MISSDVKHYVNKEESLSETDDACRKKSVTNVLKK